MPNFSVSITPEGTVSYPLHQHGQWEIMYYLSGRGFMQTESGNIPFEKGSIIIGPPNTFHGSVSENGFVNISVGGDFSQLFMFTLPIRLHDNEICEGKLLSELILNNRYGSEDYLSSLCSAYANFLLQSAKCESQIKQCIANILKQIDKNYTDPKLCVTELLIESGYAEDYIRSEFKKLTGSTPVRFLTQSRIDHAKNLLDIYGNNRTLTEIAEACGFNDVIYFSKKFKKLVGVSPDLYRKRMFQNCK